MKGRFCLVALLLLALTIGLGVLGAHSSERQVLVIGMAGEPGSLDVAYPDGMQMLVDINACASMMRIAEDASLIPFLAESWDIIDDTTYEFKLCKDATFHSGKPITAYDVKWNLDRLLTPETGAAWAYPIAMIDEIEVIDDYTLRITTQYPYAPFLANLSDWNGWFMEPEAVERWGELAGEHLVGSGPFVFKEWLRGEYIKLEAYDDFFLGRPKLDEVVFRFIPDNAARIVALEAGDIDISTAVPPHEVERLREQGFTVLTGPIWRTDFLVINTTVPPFDDVRVRQALNYAVDVESIIETILIGMTVPLTSPQPAGTLGHVPVPIYYHNVEKAKELLREAGYPDGFETVLWVPAGRYTMAEQVVEALQHQFKQVGIDAKIQIMEWGQYQPSLRAGKCKGLAFVGMGITAGDPDSLYPQLHSGERQNIAFYENPVLDILIDAGAETLDSEIRKEIYKWVQKIAMEEAPWVFLYEEPQIIATSPKVKDFVFRKMSWESFRLFRSQDDQVYIEE